MAPTLRCPWRFSCTYKHYNNGSSWRGCQQFDVEKQTTNIFR